MRQLRGGIPVKRDRASDPAGEAVERAVAKLAAQGVGTQALDSLRAQLDTLVREDLRRVESGGVPGGPRTIQAEGSDD